MENTLHAIRQNAPVETSHPGTSRAVRKFVLRLADERDREQIYRLRHEVYARELGQHPVNEAGQLRDALDEFNTYVVAVEGEQVVGFLAITPPGHGRYSIDKYFPRDQLPFTFDDRLFELRLLTVVPTERKSLVVLGLMYASYRWMQTHRGQQVMAIGREEVLRLYAKVGMYPVGLRVQSGAVKYQVLLGHMSSITECLRVIQPMLDRVEQEMDWQMGLSYRPPAPCYHGGDFFSALGDEFKTLDRRAHVISADVLDAWFPPAPKVVETLRENLSWALGTSPPTGCEGLVRAIARARGVPETSILAGAGSSDLIFLALRHWLEPKSQVLMLDPTYGEYGHVLEKVIGCQVNRLRLERKNRYQVHPEELRKQLQEGYDLVILVNPNNPTGQCLSRPVLEAMLRDTPARTRVWIDETYLEYAGGEQSLEPLAARSRQVVICKSMSKVYALSGARVAYLCASPYQLEGLRAITPPWAVSLPAQIAAVAALESGDYYAQQYAETHRLRSRLIELLRPLGGEFTDGVANFVLWHLPAEAPAVADILLACREQGLFLRDISNLGWDCGRTIRLAVKDAGSLERMAAILRQVMSSLKTA